MYYRFYCIIDHCTVHISWNHTGNYLLPIYLSIKFAYKYKTGNIFKEITKPLKFYQRCEIKKLMKLILLFYVFPINNNNLDFVAAVNYKLAKFLTRTNKKRLTFILFFNNVIRYFHFEFNTTDTLLIINNR